MMITNLEKFLNYKTTSILACSGGLDSTSLAFFLKENNFKFDTVIINHNIRKNSFKEACQVRRYLVNKGFENVCILSIPDTKIGKTKIEETAREERYNLLINYCNYYQKNAIFTAHHKNDNIETFLMRLERGSGLKGLCVIMPEIKMQNISILRPLLSTSKKEIQEYATQNKLKFVDDETNTDLTFRRNKVRYILNTLQNKALETNLDHTIKAMQNDFLALDFLINTEFEKTCKIKENKITIEHNYFLTSPDFILFHIFLKVIQKLDQKLNPRKTEILTAINRIKKQTTATLGNLKFSCKNNIILCEQLKEKNNF